MHRDGQNLPIKRPAPRPKQTRSAYAAVQRDVYTTPAMHCDQNRKITPPFASKNHKRAIALVWGLALSRLGYHQPSEAKPSIISTQSPFTAGETAPFNQTTEQQCFLQHQDRQTRRLTELVPPHDTVTNPSPPGNKVRARHLVDFLCLG